MSRKALVCHGGSPLEGTVIPPLPKGHEDLNPRWTWRRRFNGRGTAAGITLLLATVAVYAESDGWKKTN